MMRLLRASLTLLPWLGMLGLGSPSPAPARPESSAPALTRLAHSSAVHAWRTRALSVSPAPSDLALVEIEFHGTRARRRISRSTLALALGTPIGADYLAVATPSFRPSRAPRAFVLIVNRPSPLLDPARIPLRVRSAPALGTPQLWSLANPFTHRAAGLTPALCDMPLHGAPALEGSALRTLRSQGGALAGYGPAAAVAQAYDVACGLPSEAAFAAALGHATSGECTTVRAACCPPNAMCVAPPGPPTPAPPTPVGPSPPGPVPPGCAPCNPAPGYACPLVEPSVCVAPAADAGRRVAAPSH